MGRCLIVTLSERPPRESECALLSELPGRMRLQSLASLLTWQCPAPQEKKMSLASNPHTQKYRTVVLRAMSRYFTLSKFPCRCCRFTMSGCMNSRPGLRSAPVGNESSVSTILLREKGEVNGEHLTKEVPHIHAHRVFGHFFAADSKLLLEASLQFPGGAARNAVLHVPSVVTSIDLFHIGRESTVI